MSQRARYQITHETRYLYASNVAHSHHLLHLVPRPAPYQQCLHAQEDNNILIAHSLADYLQVGFSGLFLPCTYLNTTKQRMRFQSGIAYFGCPSLAGRECHEYPFGSAFDGQFGHGFTAMVTEFMRALTQSSAATGIPLPFSTRTAVGTIS